MRVGEQPCSSQHEIHAQRLFCTEIVVPKIEDPHCTGSLCAWRSCLRGWGAASDGGCCAAAWSDGGVSAAGHSGSGRSGGRCSDGGRCDSDGGEGTSDHK